MKRLALLLVGCWFVCPAAWAVELVMSSFAVDTYRLYFSVHLADLPLAEEGVAVEMYTSSVCSILPVNYERFRTVFDADTGEVIEQPEVVTVGAPAQDRWLDGVTDHQTLHQVDFANWIVTGSIVNGSQEYQPGDAICMLVKVPGSTLSWSGLTLQETAGGSVYLQKISTTRIATHAGQVIPYSYRIQNTSGVFLHDVSLSDDNVDEPPVCAFSGGDQLAPEGLSGSTVFCTAEHTVTEGEIEAETGIVNTASVDADEFDPVMLSLTIPVVLHADSFESPPNTITLLEALDGPVGLDSSIAIGADGLPVIAYSDAEGNLKVAACLDPACTAAVLSIVYGAGNFVSEPSLAIGGDERPVISYWDQTDDVLLVAKCNDAACADGDEQISAVDDGGVGRDSSLVIGADGFPVISYRDRSNGKLKVAHCNDAACSGNDETVTTLNDPDDETGVNTSIAIGDDDFPVIAYQAFMGPFAGTVRVAKCNDVACAGSDETVTTLDAIGSPGFVSTSIVVGTDGNPVVAYMDTAADVVTVVKCNDAACAGGDETISPVAPGTTYMTVGLVLLPPGNPAVSHLGSLSFTLCDDSACTGGNESTAVVDPAAVARYSSAAIGADGLPVISYHDETTGALKVVHCGTPGCR